MSTRDPYFEGFTGAKLPTDGKSLGQYIKMARDTLFGDRRDKTKAIAEHLGMSPRQVRRYMAGEVKKSTSERLDKVRDEFRADPRLRRAAVDAAGAPDKGVKVTVTGQGGPVIGDSDWSDRERPPITLSLSADEYRRMRDAYAANGNDAARQELNKAADSQYLDNFEWSRIHNIEVR